MKQLTHIQQLILLAGGILMVIGAGCFVFLWQQAVVCWVYLVGALMFTSMQAVQIYEGKDLTVRRLKRIQSLANLFFVLAGLLMIDAVHHVLLPLFRNAEGTGLYNYQALPAKQMGDSAARGGHARSIYHPPAGPRTEKRKVSLPHFSATCRQSLQPAQHREKHTATIFKIP